jgi:hypothetical protein
VAVALITASTGELHCLLPILCLAKDAHPRLRIVVVFKQRSTRARVAEDRAFSAILSDLDAELIHTRDLFWLVLMRWREVRLIFKEFGPTPSGSLPVLLKQACPRARLILFPHAYALHASGQGPLATEYRRTKKDFDQEAIDALLVSSPLDVEPWSSMLEQRKILVAGATGYTQWWTAILERYARDQLGGLRAQANGRKIVLLTTRGPSESYLTEENYRYLLTSSVEAVLARPDTFIVLKPHPREDIDHLRELLAKFPSDRIALTGLNTLAVASISALNLSFWSSAVLDSIAVGTPAIEFHRFHEPIPQSVIDDTGEIASLYTILGLALKASTRESLDHALTAAFDDLDGLLRRQQAALAACFPQNEALLGTLRELLSDLLRAPATQTTLRAAAASVLKLGRASARDLLQELLDRNRHNG